MGTRKQQRRSAKKKQKGAAAGTKNEAKEAAPTLKCTACRQVVTADTSIACPVPECDRLFCTKKCASTCVIRCASEDCPCPERCRPCSSGKTLGLLARRDVSIVRQGGNTLGHSDLSKTFVFGCAACKDRVCTRCAWKCTTCKKSLCLSCACSEGMVACSHLQCNAKYCSSTCLPKSFDTSWSACGECIANGSIVIEAGKEVGVIKGKDVDEIVLDYARHVSNCFWFITLMSELRQRCSNVAPADEAENLVRMKMIETTLDPSLQSTDEMAAMRINDVSQRLFKGVTKLGLESTLASCCDEIMTALLPDIVSVANSFSRLRNFLSCEDNICSLEKLQLDTMQQIFNNKLCGHCFRRVNRASPQRCGGCKAVYYCDENCQSLSWPAHSHLCACMKSARGAFNRRILDKQGPEGRN